MLRVGNEPNGIVYHGHFLSEPYLGKDWAGTEKKLYYVDISIEHPSDPDSPVVSFELLDQVIPEVDWHRGHSGQLISVDIAKRLDKLFQSVL